MTGRTHFASSAGRCRQRLTQWLAWVFFAALVIPLSNGEVAWGVLRVGDICRLKGQERNTLHGMGLVVGLKGTGDGSYSPTALSLMQIMNNMGVPLAAANPSANARGKMTQIALPDAKNVALVAVTANVPEQGGRQGDEIECTVSAITAKSLKGGTLLLTPMLGPIPPGEHPENARIYAFANGAIQMDNPDNPTTGKIPVGCRLEATLMNPFVKDNRITLVLNRYHASFEIAQEIVMSINNSPQVTTGPEVARAIDQLSIDVTIPEQYRALPVEFASIVLGVTLVGIPEMETVVVNETTGVIAMSANLEIEPNAVTHENMVVDIGNGSMASEFVGLDPAENASVPTLQSLVQALNALRVPAKDMIAIIRSLDRKGAIHGRVIYE